MVSSNVFDRPEYGMRDEPQSERVAPPRSAIRSEREPGWISTVASAGLRV